MTQCTYCRDGYKHLCECEPPTVVRSKRFVETYAEQVARHERELQDRIKALEAEVERLKKTEQFLRSERPMARRLTELEASVKDAERYQWIKENAHVQYWVSSDINDKAFEELDVGIDTAMGRFSPAAYGKHIGDIFNKQRVENLERELACTKALYTENLHAQSIVHGHELLERDQVIKQFGDALQLLEGALDEIRNPYPVTYAAVCEALTVYEEWKNENN